jgi:repressor LexA
MQARTRRQKEILSYITEFIENRGYEPSYQQIAKHFQIASKSAIAKHIAALEEQGLIAVGAKTAVFRFSSIRKKRKR